MDIVLENSLLFVFICEICGAFLIEEIRILNQRGEAMDSTISPF
jgi:hypothetical protein